ncbi:unnamed protein product, partial [Symbiodinium necroappetens]
ANSYRPWLMRGTLNKDTGELALLIEAGLKTLRAERVVGRQRSEAFREQPWKPAHVTKGKAAGKGRPDAVSAGFPLLMEIADDDEEDGQAKDENQSAPEAMAVEGSQAKSTKRPREGDQSRAGKESWEEKECGGQGHCFYNCVTAGFVLKTSQASFEDIQKTLPEKGRGLRARIATYVKEHPAAFRPYFHVNEGDPKAADQQAAQEQIRKVENGEAPKNWQEYLQAIFRPQRYADEIAFRAAASVILYLRHALGHYTLLIPKSEQLPEYVLTGAEVPQPTRAGAIKREPSPVGAPGGGVPERCIVVFVARLHLLRRYRLSMRFQGQVTADPPTASEHWTTRDAKRRSEQCKNAKNQFAWKCDVCNITLTTGLYDTLRRPIPLVYDCSDPKWMCFHCRWFLPACHRRVKANSIAKHIRECEQCPLHWSPIRNLCAILEEHGIRTLGEHQARLAQRFQGEVDLRTYRPKQCKQEPPSKQDPRTGFVRDLTKDGDVERNPGPSTSCDGVSRGHHTKVCTWNSQGSQNLLRAAANGLLWGSGVVMVQEAGLDTHLCRELSVMAARHHFHAFFREAECFTDVIGRPRRKHGLATFVHQDCAARLVQSTGVPGTFEALCVKVGRTFVVNVYRVPSGAEAAYCDFLQNSMQLGNHVVIGGDHNLEGHQLSGLDEFIRCVRDEGGIPLSSRVNGQRCIDYFISQGVCLSELGYGAETLSDHHCVHATAENLVHANRRASDDTLWVEQPTTRYCCPDGVSLEAWTATQAEVWHHAHTPSDEGDTEDEWRWFCATAEAGLRHATKVHGTLRDPPNRRAKGTLHRAQRVSGKSLRAGQRGPYALRKLLRLQGRIREMCRQVGRGFDAALSCQVERTWPASLGAYPGSEDAAHLLSIVDAAVADIHRKQTREGVHRWQCNLAKCGRQATAWLRGKQRVLTTVLPHEDDRVPSEALTIGDSLGNIRRFWRTVWHRPVVDRQSAVRQWKLHGRRSAFRGRLAQIFTAGNLAAQAKRKAGSSPGVDGWSGDEVAELTPEAWRTFETLLLRWFRRGSFPQVWQQSRQIHLPKDEPDIKSGSLRADQLRPITIMSVWWRVVGSCFATHEAVQRWLGQIVDESQVGGLRHRSLHMGIGSICESFEEGLAIASLDYQKCFDSVSPDLACDVLAEAGLPGPVLTALRCMWRQTRFLELSGYTSESGEVVHTSLPQGDAISPLALNVLLAAACKDIRAQSGGHFRQSVFLDDRVLATDAVSMPAALQKWAEWSRILGLQENQRKQAVICNSAEEQRTLRVVGLGRFLTQHVRVLGVDLCATVAAERPVAAARMEEALRRGARLINTAIPLTIRRELWRTRIVPRASWGHLMAPPSGVCLKNLVATFKQVACSHKMGSTALRRILEGHVMDVHFMAGMHSIRAWRKTGRAEALAQHLSAGTWFMGVVQFLNEHGWRHEAQGTFVTEGCRLDLLADEPAKADHKVRNQWRKTLFQEFCSASRRDSQMLRRWRFNEKQIAQARVLYQGASQEGRAVMLGAAHSTAFYRKQRDGDELQGCSKCGCNVVPSWEHLVWECTGIHGVEDRPVRPAASEANRLGWPMVGESVNAAAKRLRWMGSVREQVRERMGCDE